MTKVSLLEAYPEVAAEWSPINGTTPDLVTPKSGKRVWWRCLKNPEHEWESKVYSRVNQMNYPHCSKPNMRLGTPSLEKSHPHLLPEWSEDNDREMSEVTQGSAYSAKWVCSSGHEWVAKVYSRTSGGSGCRRCKARMSSAEQSLFKYVKGLYPDTEKSKRGLLGKKEIDVYTPSVKVGLEYNGLYWHSDQVRGEDYHAAKTEEACSAGIKLIHVWEDDWNLRQDAVKLKILRVMSGDSHTHQLTEGCYVKQIPRSLAEEFFSKRLTGLSPEYEESFATVNPAGGILSVMAVTFKTGVLDIRGFAATEKESYHLSTLAVKLIDLKKPCIVTAEVDRSYLDHELFETVGFKKVGGVIENSWKAYRNERVRDEEQYSMTIFGPGKYRYAIIVDMNEIITARNTEDGTVGLYPRWMVGHPLVGKYLEEVEHGAKPSVPLDDLVREKFDLPEREEPQPETDLKRKKTNV